MAVVVGTEIRGEGRVIFHDVTRYDLHRMCVATHDKYPDLETWLEAVKKNVLLCRYTEKITERTFSGLLWFYWKEG